MTTSPLPADHDVGPAVLHIDGSLTLAGGPKLLNQSLVGHQFDGGQLDVLVNAGTLCVTMRFAAGGERRFEYRGSCWYEIHKDIPIASTRSAPFTPKRWKRSVWWVVGGTMICVLAVSVCRPEDDKQSAAEADKPSVTQPMITSEPKAMPAQPQAVAKPSAPPRELTPDEILASQELSFEQKRSQLYDLADAVGNVVKETRHWENYRRTCRRLDRYRVNFTPDAERSFLQLTDRVSGYLARLKQWNRDVEQSEALIRQLESQFSQMLQAGSLDPKARTLFVQISGRHAMYLVGEPFASDAVFLGTGPYSKATEKPETFTITKEAKAKILRWQVAAVDLFEHLVAVRCCQHMLENLSGREDNVRLLSAWFFGPTEVAMTQPKPADKSPQVVEEKAVDPSESVEKANEKVSNRRRTRFTFRDQGYIDPKQLTGFDHLRELTKLREEEEERRKQVEQRAKLTNGTMAKEERERLSGALAEDAGILENALGELLLDYPWPWPVPTTPSEKKMFTLTSRPAE